MSSRIACERVKPLALAHLSRRAVSTFDSRRPIMGSMPVAGRPGFLLRLAETLDGVLVMLYV